MGKPAESMSKNAEARKAEGYARAEHGQRYLFGETGRILAVMRNIAFDTND